MADNLLRRTLAALTDAKVRFVVCGGVACVLQGVARTTHDLDARVALETEADAFDIDGRRVLVSSKRHLIVAKSSVTPPRKVDLRDIEDLEELLRGPR